MNKEKFFKFLTERIQVLEEKEKQDILNEYALHIDMKMAEGLTEEEAIQDFGDLQELVENILEAYHVNPEYCTPSKVQKKEWKKPNIEKVKEEGKETCVKAGGFLKQKMKSCKAGVVRVGRFFRDKFHKFKEKGKHLCSKKGEKDVQIKEKKEHQMIKHIGDRCKHLMLWIGRFCWNAFWIFVAMMNGILTAVALFLFAILIIWKVQGYPLTGMTLASFGIILMGGALTILALSFLKKGRNAKMRAKKVEVQYE